MKKKEVSKMDSQVIDVKPARKSRHDYAKHMQGMPEFVSKDVKPFRTILVHCQDAEAVHRLAKFVGQAISDKTRYVFYPEAKEDVVLDKRYSR